MEKPSCNNVLDKNNKQLNLKGTIELPVAIYKSDLKKEAVAYHWHEEIELIVVLEGEMELIVELEKYVLKQGEGIFINSGRLHSCVNFNSADCIIKSFVFHSRFIYGDLSSILFENYFRDFLSNTSVRVCALPQEAFRLVLSAYDIFEKKSFGYEFFTRENLTKTLLAVMESTEHNQKPLEIKAIKQLDRCKAMMSFIQQNFQNEITLLDVAQSAGIKESEALRCFKSTLKTSPIKYLKRYRIEQAAFLLKATNEPIINIGLSCGFSEMSYFSKSFKENYGITPTEYRNRPA